jgi:small conductance mechanosensitive channel
MVDLGVAYEEDLDRALRVLEEAAASFAQDPTLGPELVEPPQVLGVTNLGDSAVTVRLRVRTLPGRQWTIGRELRKFLLAACQREGVNLPYPRQEVWVRSPEGERPLPSTD